MSKHANDPAVLIVGAGIAGLMIAYRLAEYGVRPVVIEISPLVANGSTTRNQGWVHAGGLHAQSIGDFDAAMRVSARCRYGHSQIVKLCPEAIEDRQIPTVAVTRDVARVEEIVHRWQSAGVVHRRLTKHDCAQLVPHLQHSTLEAAWIVEDAVINTRLLCTKLVNLIRQKGGEVVFESRVVSLRSGTAVIEAKDGSRRTVESDMNIIACGYQSEALVQELFSLQLPIRYWKSHLLVAPRMAGANLYSVDPQDVSFMHHGSRTLIGMLHDNLQCSAPCLNVAPAQEEAMRRAVSLASQDATSLENAMPIACIKVDIADGPGVSRNLDVELVDLGDDVICAFPGKMTEAPYLADLILQRFMASRDLMMATPRPLDDMCLPLAAARSGSSALFQAAV